MSARTVLWVMGGVFLLACVAHAPGVGGSWVYDDHRFIEQNPALDRVDVAAYVLDASTASASQGIQHDVYRPLRTLSYALETRPLGRSNPLPTHVVSILLHAISAVLVVRLLRPLVRGSWVALAAAGALFAVHPVTVECVAWASSRGDLLAVLLLLATLIVLERPGVGRTVAGTILGLLAFFAKESALMLPALLVLRDLALPIGRRPSVGTTVTRTALLGIAVALYWVLRSHVIPDPAQVAEFPGGSRTATLRGMLAGYAWYAKALVWPTGFPFDLHLTLPARFSDPRVVVGAGLLLSTLAAGVWGLVRRDARLLAFACLGFLACLVPVSNVFVPLKALVAERFLYPGLVCAVAGIAWLLVVARGRWRGVLGAACVIAVVLLVPRTWQRSQAWADDETLWETVLRERPSHMRAYEGLAYEYRRRGRIKEAEIAFLSYLDYNPADAKAMFELGLLYRTIADGLTIQTPTPGTQTDVAERRRATRIEELGWYRRALATWARIGLVRGRGSPETLLRLHRARIHAATDLGYLDEARRANDELLRLAGVDPGDVEAVFRDGPVETVRTRLGLALKAITTPVPPGLDRRDYEARMKERARVVEGVGIPPSTPDRQALLALVPRYEAFLATGDASVADRLFFAALLEDVGRGADAARIREEARAQDPDHPLLRGAPR